MRFVFLVPDLDTSKLNQQVRNFLYDRVKPLRNYVHLRVMRTTQVFGGTLNIMRHCQVARSCGVDAVLATNSGQDTYGPRGIQGLPYISWADRRPDDVCIVPDFVSQWMDEIEGPAIAYQQVPIHTLDNFDWRKPSVAIWTDSPHMEEICKARYPGKPIVMVPNVVDCEAFPFIPQDQRQAGVLFAFPRKGAEFIDATEAEYRRLGGNYWKFERIDGLSFQELAKEFRRAQVFLASADMEGCALPPQESMAAGLVVVGKTAQGANFCMQDGETAMVAETPEKAAQHLRSLEDAALRDRISRNAHAAISRYFPTEDPKRFWQSVIQSYQKVAA